MGTEYKTTSPWYTTGQPSIYVNYLDMLQYRSIPPQSTDITIVIDPKYENRPELLAYDLYGDVNLWWVFAARNMDIIIDPIFDFKPGLEIIVPEKNKLLSLLGA